MGYVDKKYKATAIPSVIDIAVKNLISERQNLLGLLRYNRDDLTKLGVYNELNELISRLTRVINDLSSIRDKLRG